MIGFYIWDSVARHSSGWLFNSLCSRDTPSIYFDVYWPDNENGQGFIILEYDPSQSQIEVSRVRRPTDIKAWFPDYEPSDGVRPSFCSVVLPLAIQDFYTKLELSEIESFLIINDSDNRVEACKCYAKTLDVLGYTRIDEQVWDRKKLERACIAGDVLYMHAEPSIRGDVSPHFQETDEESIGHQILRRAQISFVERPHEDDDTDSDT